MLSEEEIEKILDQNENIITYKADKDFRGLTSSERTLLKNNKKIREYIDQLEQENNKLSKMTDEMTEDLVGITVLNIEKDKFIDLDDKEEVKQYFEKKVEKK